MEARFCAHRATVSILSIFSPPCFSLFNRSASLAVVKETFTAPDTSQGEGWFTCDNRRGLVYCEGLSVAGVAGCVFGGVSVHVTRRGLTYISVPLKGSAPTDAPDCVGERLTVLLAGFA